MIRAIVIASLTALLVLVLYLPSAHPPERFLGHLRREHIDLGKWWGGVHANRVLSRALDAHKISNAIVPQPDTTDIWRSDSVNQVVSAEMSAVNARLFQSDYFRSVDALALLATYRLFAILEWAPWIAAFALAATIDGAIIRGIKAKLFGHHNPELYSVSVLLATLVIGGTLIALVMPATAPPLLLPSTLASMAVLVNIGLRNFHRRG